MSNEVKEAAERLREEFEVHSSGIARDACVVAEAYLAEHAADDGEAVTAEWLRTVGFYGKVNRPLSFTQGELTLVIEGPRCWINMGMRTKHLPPNIKTRGDVRRLCNALGVELKESGDE